MITTKAYITATPVEGDNKFYVNIPLMADNVNEEAIFEALLCSTSGNYNDYKVGDCVFVDFEDDKYNTAIIMGKLYTEVPEENEAYGLFNELKVTGSVVLPENTKIGKYSPQDIFNLYQAASNLKLPDLENLVDFDDLEAYVNKNDFNIFFGEEYFSDDFPFDPIYEFDNELEDEEEEEKDRLYNTNFNPDYKTLKDRFKEFLQVRFNKFLGLEPVIEDEEEKVPSVTQTLAKMEEEGSQTYDSSKIISGQSPVNTNYYPNYNNLIDHLKKFFKDIVSFTFENFVQFYKTDPAAKQAKKVRVMTGSEYDSVTKDPNTLYFLTSLSSRD